MSSTSTYVLPSQRKNLLTAAILLSAHSAVYLPVWSKLISTWDNKPQSSHGYLILPICIWLCWNRRKNLTELRPQPSYGGIFVTAVGMLCYIGGIASEVETLANFSFMISLGGIIIAIFGLDYLKAYIFSFFFLLFMFPIPDILYLKLTAPLKLVASSLSFSILQSLGFAVLRDGNVLQLPNFHMEVVEACSGMQSLISFFMLSVLVAYFFKGAIWKKTLIILSALPISILNNVVRITATGILGELYGEGAVHGSYHTMLGVLSFAFGMILLFIVNMIFSIRSRNDL